MTKKLNHFNFDNEEHIAWLQGYLSKRHDHLFTLAPYLDIGNIFSVQAHIPKTERFDKLVSALEKNAEGRELWRQLYGAWHKKQKRDSNNRIKSYSFELDVAIKSKLNFLSKGSTIKDTLEKLITGVYQEEKNIIKNNKQIKLNNLTAIQLETLKFELDKEKERVKYLSSILEENGINFNLK
ncbi:MULTISPECIES: hypothetical protein [Aliivibrio]|uniref:Uncharacterized protein n=2 Tax=Aliivibrio TaxID=511678 RepID=A0A4Q5KVJ8_9GAMM|nr:MULTISPECIES: hypothetical protein [Aliivibrio]MDD9180427.1 hypothetical protein [Aliivibrio sp. A6]PQJ89102.1 hypothetical protein BTO22_05680 [Aliivibrio sifiae]RYU52526.1 hypothetical protein ERW57_06985 [Aliivibrio finisterrensis]RYU55079.1 hypothetical protein ERW56_04600 [Aliivibrio finisterrensis]RYU59738.1 hypothetical protein ERW50_04615 [Aliivibrio finisterrensis]